MPARTLSSQLPEQAGKSIMLLGWIHRIRNFGGLRFVLLRDRDGITQVVAPTSIDLANFTSECVVRIDGDVRTEPRAPGGFEVVAREIKLIAQAEAPPIDIFKPPQVDPARLETLFDHRAVTLRIPEVLDIFRIQSEIVRTFRAHLNASGFTEIFTPKLVLAGAEGGSAVFEVKYYDRKAYLGQSPQFYKQMMVGSGQERVFEVGHAYRAEKSETSRHLTEFVSLDLEMGFIESEQDVMAMLVDTIVAIFESLRSRCAKELARRKLALPEIKSIPQIDLPEAQKILREKFGKTTGIEGDLDTEAEKLIGQWAEQELKSPLIFVTGYAVNCRPVYTMPLESDPSRTRSFDLLHRGVEISTGGQRIHLYPQLVESFTSRGLNPADVEGYLGSFKHGMPPHGGMGLGLERFTKQLLNLSNVKEASLFPRDRNRLTP